MRVAGGLAALLLGTGIVIVQPAATALTPKEISEIAQQITVRIDGANIGSGVIIEREGNNYTVLTCEHVVRLKGSYTVHTPDGKQYTINNSQVKQLPGVDLAVFQFTSNQNYRVAEKGNSEQVTLGTNVHVAGYPQGTSDIEFLSGSISRLVTKPKKGYALVYSVGGLPGMSGGPILNEDGKLVGIHGQAGTHPGTNATTVLGIPLKTYLSLASSAQPVATAPAPKPPVSTTPTPKPQNPLVSTAPAPKPPKSPVVTAPSAAKFTLAKTLIGHSHEYIFGKKGEVSSVAFSPDGRTLVSGSSDTTIKIWNLATGQEIRTLNGHSSWVNSVAFSPDGKTLASGSSDDTIKIWNLVIGQEIRTLNGHPNEVWSNEVWSVAISPDARTLASGNRTYGIIKIWNLATGQEIRTLKGHPNSVWSLAFSPDSKTLASGSEDTDIKIWNLATGQEIRSLNDHSMSVNSVAISPDGRTLVSGSNDTIRIWNLATGQVIRALDHYYVRSVAISPDGRTLASGNDKTIKIWDLVTKQEIQTLEGYSSINSVAFSPDGKTLASGSDDATIKIWRQSE